MELLRNITKAQLKKYLDDDYYRGLIAEEIYKMAHTYVSRVPIKGLERDDYVQELFMNVWKRINKFDEKIGKFSTFCFMWFYSYSSTYRRKLQNGAVILRLDAPSILGEDIYLIDAITSFSKTQEDTIVFEEFLDGCCEELQLWVRGYKQHEIEKIVGKTQATVSRRISNDIKRLREEMGIVIDDK